MLKSRRPPAWTGTLSSIGMEPVQRGTGMMCLQTHTLHHSYYRQAAPLMSTIVLNAMVIHSRVLSGTRAVWRVPDRMAPYRTAVSSPLVWSLRGGALAGFGCLKTRTIHNDHRQAPGCDSTPMDAVVIHNRILMGTPDVKGVRSDDAVHHRTVIHVDCNPCGHCIRPYPYPVSSDPAETQRADPSSHSRLAV